MVKTVKSKAEAQNLIDYMHTSFFRFMMLLAKNGHNLTNRVYRYVPVLDLSKNGLTKCSLRGMVLQKQSRILLRV